MQKIEKNLNKNGSRSTKRLKISKKDMQKLNLKIEENNSITKLSVKKNKGRPSNKNKKSYKNSGLKNYYCNIAYNAKYNRNLYFISCDIQTCTTN